MPLMPSNDPFIPKSVKHFLARINNPRRSPAEEALDRDTAAMPGTMNLPNIVGQQSVCHMASQAEEANFLALQTRLLGLQHNRPMKALDIGTFTGRSALAIAQAMPHGGTVITCERNPASISDGADRKNVQNSLDLAQKHWAKSTVKDRIRLTLGPASDTLAGLLAHGEQGQYDLAFIDADKPAYDHYYELALKLVRCGGLIILDNMLWSGRVADASAHDANTDALRALSEKIAEDQRVDSVLTGIGDGIMLVYKRGSVSAIS